MLQYRYLTGCLLHLADTAPRLPNEGLFIPLSEPIRLTSVAHSHNVNHLLVVQHLVDHAVMPDANTPKILKTLKLATTRRAWILGQCLYLGEYTSDDAGVKVFQFLPR